MEEMLRVINATVEALAASLPLKCFFSTLFTFLKQPSDVCDSPVSNLVPLVQATMAPMLG